MSDETSPDHTTDPREQGVAESGYPETNPESATEGEGDGPGQSGGDTDGDAPSPSTDKEADRGQTTGNPDAAG